MTRRDQLVRILRWISLRVSVRDGGDTMRTVKGKRWGEKVLLPGVDWEWTEDLLEGQ